jgi:ABC-type amino acid transport substrate-binding protein
MPRWIAIVACALSLLASCVPPEESNDRIKRYDPDENIMGQIQERGLLRVGLPEDHPPLAILDEGSPKGFLVDLAELVAESLGVETEYLTGSSSELMSMVFVSEDRPQAPTEADLVFPIFPITESLVGRKSMTDPYWVGHTRMLDGPPDFGAPIGEPIPDLELLAYAYEHAGKIAGEQLSTEGYGAAVRDGAVTFATLVSQVINEADAEGDWSRFYKRWLADYFAEPDPEDVPIMTVEEAAALYPSDID